MARYRTIISQLSLSPASVVALGEYATTLRRRQHTRKITLITLLVLLILQLIIIAIPSPSEAPHIQVITCTPSDGVCKVGTNIEQLFQALPQINPFVTFGIYIAISLPTLIVFAAVELRLQEIRLVRKHLNSGSTL